LTRLLDVLASLLGLILLSPLFLLVAVAIKLDSVGPVFYRAMRVGREGRPFQLYKFRSMVNDADRGGPEITTAADERITELGRLLRRTKVDELPQLINVLRGQMSLVGPRPEDPCYVALYTREQRQVLAVRPGITSTASVRYRHEEELLSEAGSNWKQVYIQEVMPHKLQMELDYLERRTLWTDLGVIIETFMAMLR
jgi:lipopolysaccharide/colanic/teichoic acid biosynthesis glycosyltransferase